MDFLTITV